MKFDISSFNKIVAFSLLLSTSMAVKSNQIDKKEMASPAKETAERNWVKWFQASKTPITVENDIDSFLALGDLPEELAHQTRVKVNQAPLKPKEQRKMPAAPNKKYDVHISMLPGFAYEVATISAQAANPIKAALIKAISMPLNPFTLEIVYQHEHADDGDHLTVSETIIDSPLADLIDQPNGLWQTLREFYDRSTISWDAARSLRIELADRKS